MESIVDRDFRRAMFDGQYVVQLFQMDQAASANQGLLRNQRERREDPDLDCGVDLCAGADGAQATRSGSQSLPDSTDSLFEKTPILRALQACDSDNDLFDTGNQLILFNF
jgi:hypothetical protein